MSGVNPYYSGRRSTPMSHFVDESLPVELMLQAGTAKQAQQDSMMSLVDKASLWDADSIKGGDTDLIDDTKEKIKEFSIKNSNRNLTGAKAQSDVKRFLTGITTDKELKQAKINFEKVKAMKESISKLENNPNASAFQPSIKKAQRELDAYMNDHTKRGQEFGKIDIQAALDLEKKEASYTDQMLANGNESFDNTIKNLPAGFLGKAGWQGITDDRIIKRSKEVAADYANTPEGLQALAIYRELVEDFQNGSPNGIDPDKEGAQDYLAKRILHAGKEKVYSRSAVGAQQISTASGGGNDDDKIKEPITDPSNNTSSGTIDREKYEEVLNDPDATKYQKQKALVQRDKVHNSVKNSVDGKTLNLAIKDLTTGNTGDIETSLPVVKATDMASEALARMNRYNVKTSGWGRERTDSLEKAQKQATTALKPLWSTLENIMPGIIEQEISVKKNLDFANNLADKHNGGIFTFGFKTGKDKKEGATKDEDGYVVPGLYINDHAMNGQSNKDNHGFLSFKDLGVTDEAYLHSFTKTPEEIAEGKKILSKSGRVRSPYGSNVSNNLAASLAAQGLNFNLYSSSNSVHDDGTDKLANVVKQYNELIDKREGTQVISNTSLRPPDKENMGELVQVLGSASTLNFDITNSGVEIEDEAKQALLNSLTNNVASGNASVRVNTNSRTIEATIGKGDDSELIQIKEKVFPNGTVAETGTFDDIFNRFEGLDPGRLGGASQLSGTVSNTAIPIYQAMGQFGDRAYTANDGSPLPRNYKIQLADETMKNDDYILSSNNGKFTNGNKQRAYELMYDPATDLSDYYTPEKADIVKSNTKAKAKQDYIMAARQNLKEGGIALEADDNTISRAFDLRYASLFGGNVDGFTKLEIQLMQEIETYVLTLPAIANDYNDIIRLATLMSADPTN